MRTIALLPCLLSLLPIVAQDDADAMLAGLQALRRDDHTRAEKAFTTAVERNPADEKAWYYRAVNRLAAGDAIGAKHDLDHLIALDPAHAHAYLRRSEALAQLGDMLAAERDLDILLRHHPTGPAAEHALLQLGHFAMLRGEVAEALRQYDRLVAISPENAMGRCNRGIAFAALGRDQEARSDLEKTIALDASLDQAHANLGIVLIRLGEREHACSAFAQAHALGDASVEEMLLIWCE